MLRNAIRSLFRSSRSQVPSTPKTATVYIRRDDAETIVVAMLINEHGILYEDDYAWSYAGQCPAKLIGVQLLLALEKTTFRPMDLRNRKRSEWPAYRASKATSIRKFETDYIRISIRGANEANVTFEIVGIPFESSELEILMTLSSSVPPDDFGNAIRKIFEACRDRKF